VEKPVPEPPLADEISVRDSIETGVRTACASLGLSEISLEQMAAIARFVEAELAGELWTSSSDENPVMIRADSAHRLGWAFMTSTDQDPRRN
jgi:hypothetical protein